jgi:hypothetical protein
MNISKKDLKRAVHYWAKGQYELWKQLQAAKVEIKRLKKVINENTINIRT